MYRLRIYRLFTTEKYSPLDLREKSLMKALLFGSQLTFEKYCLVASHLRYYSCILECTFWRDTINSGGTKIKSNIGLTTIQTKQKFSLTSASSV